MLRALYQKFQQAFGQRLSRPSGLAVEGCASGASMRVLILANGNIPTVELGLGEPLAPLVRTGEVATALLTEQMMKARFGKELRSATAWAWVKNQIETFSPTVVVLCRYTGPHVEALLAHTRAAGIASVFCIDDDLLNVPIELGEQKRAFHNHPLRLEACRAALYGCDVVYCANPPLRDRLWAQLPHDRYIAGDLFCAGEIIAPAVEREAATLGYMGFDHAHDFEVALPGVVAVMQAHPALRFEIFGKIPKPAALDAFGDRVSVLPPVQGYQDFMRALAARRWDVGICPLADTAFNQVKNINKWIEYSAVGCATVASRGLIYDACCADGAGLLVDADGWAGALEALVSDPALRYRTVAAAQARLARDYNLPRLQAQVLRVFDEAKQHAAAEDPRRCAA